MPGLSIVSAKWPEEHTASLPATPFSKLTTQRPGGSFMAIFWFLQSAKQTQGHQRGNKCRATCHLFELFREGREVWTSWSWITPLLSHHMLTPQVEGTEPDTCSVPLGQHDGSVSGSQILTPLPHRHGDGRLSSVRVLRGCKGQGEAHHFVIKLQQGSAPSLVAERWTETPTPPP